MFPAASVLVVPGIATRAGYAVQVCMVGGLSRRRVTVGAVDLPAVALVLAHALEGRHACGNSDPACPLCQHEGGA